MVRLVLGLLSVSNHLMSNIKTVASRVPDMPSSYTAYPANRVSSKRDVTYITLTSSVLNRYSSGLRKFGAGDDLLPAVHSYFREGGGESAHFVKYLKLYPYTFFKTAMTADYVMNHFMMGVSGRKRNREAHSEKTPSLRSRPSDTTYYLGTLVLFQRDSLSRSCAPFFSSIQDA